MDTLELPVGDMTFRARAAGPADGRVVLLLHGFPESSLEWRSQLEALAAEGYRAVAPDQRGYSPGARPEGVDAYQVSHLVADVLAIADWVGAHQVDVVGHDWGAAVAWQLAARAPDRVRSLTAVSVPHPAAFGAALAGDGEQRDRSSYINLFREEGNKAEEVLLADGAARLRAFYRGIELPAETLDAYVSLLQEPGALTAALNWYRAMDRAGFASVPPVEVPTLFVWSTGDPAIGRRAAEACGEHVTGPYRFEVLDGVSHWIPEEAPDTLNRLLLEHLAGV